MKLLPLLFLLLIGQAPLWGAALQPQPAVAFLEDLRGTVKLKPGTREAERQLDPKRDVPRWLFVGETIIAGPGAAFRVVLDGKAETYRGQQTFTVPRPGGSRDRLVLEAIRKRFGRGARARGREGAFLSPPGGGVVVPRLLVLRWDPPQAAKVTLTLRDEGGRPLWEEAADGIPGRLDSPALRRALLQYRAEGGRGPLTLSLAAANEPPGSARFFLLPPAMEQELDRRLADLDTRFAGSPLRHLARAEALAEQGLWVEAAAECEQALDAAPDSADLLVAAIAAARLAGDEIGARELERRLAPASKNQ